MYNLILSGNKQLLYDRVLTHQNRSSSEEDASNDVERPSSERPISSQTLHFKITGMSYAPGQVDVGSKIKLQCEPFNVSYGSISLFST